MVSQGDMAPEGQGAPSRPARGGGCAAESPGESRPLVEGFQKCPYLAGRPPCGTHHLFPSGTNVCWAEAGEGKSYRAISRETQRELCFGEPDGPRGCERYQRAAAAARPLPRFEARRAAGPPRLDEVVPPHPSSRRPDTLARVWRQGVWLLPLCLTALLLLLLLR